MALTQESILSFLLEHGGKVKNSELVNNFRSEINCSDPAEKQHNRDLFKRLVNSVAVVKQIDEVKFVVVKKRYQDFVKDGAHDAHKTQMVDTFHSHSTSVSSPHRDEADSVIYSDIQNNNVDFSQNINYNNSYGDAKRVSVGKGGGSFSTAVDTSTVKVLNISADHVSRAGKSGAVFAVIAVKSPTRECDPAARDGSHLRQHKALESEACVMPTLTSPDALNDNQCRKTPRHTEDTHPPGFSQVRPQSRTLRPAADDAKYSESVPLEPLAHEWLVKCAAGLWGQIHALLLRDTRLAQKKDFMSGFTALHWAAKDGNSEVIRKLMDVSRRRGTDLNVNSKTHGGYTPLHIAAMHGHTEVMVLLVQRYGASVNERDNAGKKAFHYLGQGVSADTRALLGGLQQSRFGEKTEEDDYRDHSKGFNTISKLFQPHMGRKHKTTTKCAHDW
ncbi:ankyrin repeat domain-containing protein SOWAHA [Solea solea]|uniref:ankyrin repeat domain-containing protein SOWAHA n=1 Tax=Solea solea TaxID=90069 RepID=UPI00272AC50E|nr:ankyrin repeat domain-containing protein SOWAHA [Solea solea]